MINILVSVLELVIFIVDAYNSYLLVYFLVGTPLVLLLVYLSTECNVSIGGICIYIRNYNLVI